MALRLALVEAGILTAAVYTSVLLWGRPLMLDWLDVVAVASQGLALALACVVAFYYSDLYDLRVVGSFGEYAARLLQAFGVAFILLAVFYTLFPGTRVATGPFLSSLVMILGVLVPLRALSYAILKTRPFHERLLLLGRSALARRIAEEIEAQPYCRYRVARVLDDETPDVLGRALAQALDEVRPDRVVVALGEQRGRLPVGQLLAARVRGVAVEQGVEIHERLTGQIAIESLRPSDLLFTPDFRKTPLDLLVGRAVSFTAALVGATLAWPLLLAIAAAIRLDSPGPALFVQERAGLGGRPFRLVKFRTMHPGAHTSEWARDNEQRITRVGRWLRQFRLDELPQFWNILRGDMNLVGPRPHPCSNLPLFEARIPYYALRLAVRPGVTGWAQVRFGYANTLEEEIDKMRYDLYYVKHLSPWLDFHILCDTVKSVLFGRGSRTADAYPAPARVEARSR